MIDGPAILTVFFVYLAGVIIPGPNFVAVVRTSSSWYGMVTLVLSQPRIASAYRRAKKSIDRLCGGLILLLGVRQLVQ